MKISRRVLFPLNLLLLAAIACSLPGLLAEPTPEPTGIPIEQPATGATPEPLPPNLVETLPRTGEPLPPEAPFTMIFDQAMDQPSVESALFMQPDTARRLDWIDDRTLTLQPTEPLDRAARYQVTIGTSAKSALGLSPLQPLTTTFQTAGFFQVSQVQPEPASAAIATTSDIHVAFSEPVVALGSETKFPHPLRFDPPVSGRGEWMGTSLYIFHPEPALPAGQSIRVGVDPELTSSLGAILSGSFSWTFSTGRPRLTASSPAEGASSVPLDAAIQLEFNQPLSRGSLEESLIFRPDDGQPLPGTYEWSDDLSQVTFTPLSLLDYDRSYSISFEAAEGPAGSALAGTTQLTFRTVPTPRVQSTYPSGGGTKPVRDSVRIGFSGPMSEASLFEAVTIEPLLESQSIHWDEDEYQLLVRGDYRPRTEYTVRIDLSAQDVYGTPLSTPVNLSFRTGDYPPLVELTRFEQVLSFVADGSPAIELQVRNVTEVDLDLYQLDLGQALSVISNSYQYLYEGRAIGQPIRSWTEAPALPPNQTHVIEVPLSDSEPLPTGFYLLHFDSAQDESARRGRLLLLRNTELVLKAAQDSLSVWAADLSTGQPLDSGSVRLLDGQGSNLSPVTPVEEGMAQVGRPSMSSVYDPLYAMVGQPGEAEFGFTNWTWSHGAEPYRFGVRSSFQPREQFHYLYTDRPLYRPGQEVHFRGALRRIEDDELHLPQEAELEALLHSPEGERLASHTAPLSEYGTFHGTFQLAAEAELGNYWIRIADETVYFDVAAYRKPEFEIQVDASTPDVILGDPLTAVLEAEYFFGGPVSRAEVTWSARALPYRPPDLPIGARFGFFEAGFPGDPRFGTFVAQGSGLTDAEGKLLIEVPTELEDPESLEVTIEATIQEQDQLPVSGRTVVRFHPADLYYSVVPQRYSLRVDETVSVRLHARDYGGEPMPGQSTQVSVSRVTWEQILSESGELEWQQEETLVNRDGLTTESDGSVLFSFIPRRAGTYRIDVEGEDQGGNPSSASSTVWVVGASAGIWRRPSPNQLVLVPDRESYEPGQTAQVLIPSPFDSPARVWITVERDTVLYSHMNELPPEGMMLELPLEAKFAPNVFLSVVALEPRSEERPASLAMGLVPLQVSAEANRLQVQLEPDVFQAEPGDQVTFALEATNYEGDPAHAEFSLALVDEALLSLAEPNSQDPFAAFYGDRSLSVRTASSLALSGEGEIETEEALGRGGGGGGDLRSFELRQEFEDTALWIPDLVTDESGRASATVTLPDNLTTWRMEARGLTADTEVGSQETTVQASKPLLIRPQTPRFFTAGDRSTVAAIVHNNTGAGLPVSVRLQASGARVLSSSETEFNVPDRGSRRVNWILEVDEVPQVELTFAVEGGGFQDASTPTLTGDGVPVLRYQAPFTRATSGWLPESGSRVEAVSLPATFDPSSGDLTILLEPNLGAAVHAALDEIRDRPYQSTEHLASRVMLASELLMSEAPDSSTQKEAEVNLSQALQTLVSRQNFDGGWGWWENSSSQTQLSAYALLALQNAETAGYFVSPTTLDRASDYLFGSMLVDPDLLDELDRIEMAYVLSALAQTGDLQPFVLQQWGEQADILPITAASLVSLRLHEYRPQDASLSRLLADIESKAILSATGAHWEDGIRDYRLYMGNVAATAHALRALMQLNPESPSIEPAIRWLLQARDGSGGWYSAFDSTWASIALIEWTDLNDAWQADFEYTVRLNGRELATAEFTGTGPMEGVRLVAGLSELTSERPNALRLSRSAGQGRLSYQAHLTVFRPAEQVPASSRGLSVERSYFLDDGQCNFVEDPCTQVQAANTGEDLLVQLSLIVPSDVYNLVVEDRFPAGTEPIDPGLQTSSTRPVRTSRYGLDWLGWWFNRTQIDDERVLLFADYLPGGTYTFTYRLHASFAGTYQVLPARAQLEYFPDVYGQTAGMIFQIDP